MSSMQANAEEHDRQRRIAWFRQARFGMFIHWGLYAQLGRHEWVMNRERIPVEEYEKLADTWKPQPNAAREWARLAKATGMRYMVMTTKHHEGFCLFDSQLTDYNAVKRGPGRDLVAEYVEAARAEGMRVGFYYSLCDWHHPDWRCCATDEACRRRFVDYTFGLVRELCTNYGTVDIMWYDGGSPLDAEGWEAAQLNAMVRKLQPNIIINNRSHPPEDFGTPEQHIVAESKGRMWEACMTMNQSWGYTPIDHNWKSAWDIVQMLRQVAGGAGNLLLNIGPMPDGTVPYECVGAFHQVGQWLCKYGPTIYDATDPMVQEWQTPGAFTRLGNTVYFHCWNWPGIELTIGGLRNQVREARFFAGDEINFSQDELRLVLHGLPRVAPDPLATVIELKVEGEPRQVLGFDLM